MRPYIALQKCDKVSLDKDDASHGICSRSRTSDWMPKLRRTTKAPAVGFMGKTAASATPALMPPIMLRIVHSVIPSRLACGRYAETLGQICVGINVLDAVEYA